MYQDSFKEIYLLIEPRKTSEPRRYDFITDEQYRFQCHHKVDVNYERLSHISWILYYNYKLGTHFYENSVMPQEVLPENISLGSKEHALWLFYNSLSERGAQKSMSVFDRYVQMFEQYPEVFDPETISSEKIDLLSIFKEARLIQHNKHYQLLDYWKNNSKILLQKEPTGDPRKLIFGAKNYEELCDIFDVDIKNKNDGKHFQGFQHKVVSLFGTWAHQFGWIENNFPYPVPIDLHYQRIFGVTQCYLILGDYVRNDPLRDILRPYDYQFARDSGTETLDRSQAFWHLGRFYCTNNPQHRQVNAERRYEARRRQRGADAEAKKGELLITENIPEGEVQKPEPGTPILPSPKAKFGKCNGCPIDPECEFNLSSAPYYDKGHTKIAQKRIKSPQQYRMMSLGYKISKDLK